MNKNRPVKLTVIIAIGLFFIISNNANSQQNTNKFPESWLGTYHGNMLIIRGSNIDTVNVKFEFG